MWVSKTVLKIIYVCILLTTVKLEKIVFVTSFPLSVAAKLYVSTAVLHSARAHYSTVRIVSVFRQPCMLNVGQCITVCCSGNKTCVSTGRHWGTIVTHTVVKVCQKDAENE
jgi:hypothetical protein